MSDILNHIEEHPQETQRLIGLDYEPLQQLIQNAERLHHEKQALLESNKVRIIAGGGGRKPKLSLGEQIILTLVYLRVRASQSALTKGFEKKHHVFIIHCSPFSFLSQATLESSFLIYSIQGHPSDNSQVSRAIQGANARSIFIESDI